MKASRWVLGCLGVVVLLAGCGGSSGDSTRAVETVARETVPIPADTFAATTTLAPPTTVPPTTMTPNSEEALRSRVLDYHRTFVEEQLQMPNTDFAQSKSFYASPADGDYAMALLIDMNRSGGSTKKNDPVIDQYEILRIKFDSVGMASVTTCETNNYITMDGGPDRAANTADDKILSDSLGSRRTIDEWTFKSGRWQLGEYSESKLLQRTTCDE